MHEGVMESDKDMLAVQCNELITWNNDCNAPDLFYLCGAPRTCGRIIHVAGRKVKNKK